MDKPKDISKALAQDLYRRMVLIREVEEKIAVLYPEQEMRCPTHLSIGHEAVSAGICAALEEDDAVFLNHRCHAGYIAKGGDVPRMIAELYGKKTGCTLGRGGSMHLVDPEKGLIGTSAILGGTIPIACGAAFGYMRQGQGRVAVCFFGDAGFEEGVVFESLNIAALWKLPVIFVCENNGYSTCTPLSKRQPPLPISGRAAASGVPAETLDGNDVVAMYYAAKLAVERARSGAGPSFIEGTTYRWLEHVGPNYDWNVGYRTKEEVESWKERCPIKQFEKRLDQNGLLAAPEREKIRDAILKDVEKAVRFAKESPFPEPSELLEEFA